MEFKEFNTVAVFNAARDGKLCTLKLIFKHLSEEEVALLVSSCTNDTTPLVMACKNGHLDVAQYLIEECQANVEQVGLIFDGDTIMDGAAAPLWCAAAVSHLDLVKLLVRCGASVNRATRADTTPLWVACFNGNFEIAKYLIQHGADIEMANCAGYTCLMVACSKHHYDIAKYLIQCGADVNKKSLKGKTALHDAAESSSIETLKLLLDSGAKLDRDSCGISPLSSAAVIGHADVVEYFIHQSECSTQEKVDALELLGATFMDKKRDMSAALYFWKRAMQLRYEDGECPLEKPIIEFGIASYVDATEVRTLAQLEELISDPDEMSMQALLIRERILGPDHPETMDYIMCRGLRDHGNNNFDRCIRLWLYALDVQQKVQEPLSMRTKNTLLAFSELFAYMLSEAHSFAIVHFRDMLRVFDRVLKEIETGMKSSPKQDLDRTLIIAMHLLGLICSLQPHIDKSEELELKKAAYKLVDMNPRASNGFTPLHYACFRGRGLCSRLISFPSPAVVELLLEVGACPNAVDFANQTPLHVSARNVPFDLTVFESLLNHGAHLDLCDYRRQTPLQIAEGIPLIDLCPLQYVNLQCLSARAVRNYNIPYKGFVNKSLEMFLDGH